MRKDDALLLTDATAADDVWLQDLWQRAWGGHEMVSLGHVHPLRALAHRSPGAAPASAWARPCTSSRAHAPSFSA